jgi:Fur family ferric uptake transcriptional regulator
MSNTTAQVLNLLQHTQGRITPIRLRILELLLQSPTAISHLELEQLAQQTGIEADRVTLYRTLDWLVEQGLAHKITGVDRVSRYNALAEFNAPHAHFACERCKQVFCLERIQPAVLFTLPTGFKLNQVDITLTGQCANCSNVNAI